MDGEQCQQECVCVCVRQKSLCENEGKAARDGETKTGGRQAGSGDEGQRGGGRKPD